MSADSFDVGSYRRVEELSDSQVSQLCELYANEFWSKGRQIDDVRRMLSHTDVIVAFADADTDELIAFARVLTDEVYKAFVFDVIVRVSHRGMGLGKLLIDAVLMHPRVRTVSRVELYCRPALGEFYARWGFVPAGPGLQLMLRRAETA